MFDTLGGEVSVRERLFFSTGLGMMRLQFGEVSSTLDEELWKGCRQMERITADCSNTGIVIENMILSKV